MSVVVCEHDYWKVEDKVRMVHNGDTGIVKQVERHSEILVLTVDFYSGETRKVISNLLQKVEG